MTSSRRTLDSLDAHLAESVGRRTGPQQATVPQPQARDAGRRPDGEFGRIETRLLQPDPDQPRQLFELSALQQLAESLRRSGQLAPIVARWCSDREAWLIVAGERRWRAAQAAGIEQVACRFLSGAVPEAETLELQLVENLLREDLRPIEEAKGLRRLMDQHDYTGKQVAQALAVPESRVSRMLALLKLPEDIQKQVDDRQISVRSAYELTKEQDDERLRLLARRAAGGDLRHDQINQLVRKRRARATPKGVDLRFPSPLGGVVQVRFKEKVSYDAVEAALVEALEEVRQRIRGRVRLF